MLLRLSKPENQGMPYGVFAIFKILLLIMTIPLIIKESHITIACLVISGLIFILDFYTPLGFAMWLLYIVPISICSYYSGKNSAFLVTAVCTLLSIAGFFVSPLGIPTFYAAVNRVLGMLISIYTAFLLINVASSQRKLESSEAALTQRNEELEQVNRELESFTYTVSHDLRAPLRAINGFSDMLLKDIGDRLDPDSLRKFDVITRNAVKMGRLIDDLLSFSRSGRTPLSMSLINMGALVNDVWRELRDGDPERKIELKAENLLPALGDRNLVRQAVLNLLDNAVKFTRGNECAEIHVGAERQNGTVKYFVRDNGTGFDMRYYNKVFQIFSRLHNESEFEGTGVGLAIVKRIIDRHGGKIWAESSPGQGSVFYFTLPGGRQY